MRLQSSSAGSELVDETTRVAEARTGVYKVEKLLIRKMGLYYVADNLEIKPERVPTEAELIALWDSVLEKVVD